MKSERFAIRTDNNPSLTDDMPSSQDTVDLDEEDEVTAPVISLESIKRVVSFSQSFTESPTEVLPSSQPQSKYGYTSKYDI